MEKRANWGAQIFLVLFPAAVGCLLGGLVLSGDGGAGAFPATYLSVALVLAVVGALAPVAGIKKPWRSYRMMSGVARSPLSRQAVLVALFLVLVIVHWALVLGGVHLLPLAVLVLVIGVAAVLAAGLVYVWGSQPAWRHWSTVATLFSGLLALGVSLSMVLALGWQASGLLEGARAAVDRVLILVGVVLLAAAIWAWAGRLADAGRPTAAPGGRLVGSDRTLLWAGLALAVLVAGVTAVASFAAVWLLIATFLALLAGLFLLRRLFFTAAAPPSWKTEVRWSSRQPITAKEG